MLRVLRVILVTAVGFLLGMVLAGVGGLPAKTLLFGNSSEKIEKYWLKTHLNSEHVSELISNTKCHSTEKYFKACVSSVAQTLLGLGLRAELADAEVRLVEDDNVFKLEELTEEQLLRHYLSLFAKANWNFDRIVDRVFKSEKNVLIQETAADFINAFLAVYVDPHSYIIPRDYYSDVGSKIDRSKYFVGLSYHKRNGHFVITDVSKNSDAELAGLKAGDVILNINTKNLVGAPYQAIGKILKNESTESFSFSILRDQQKMQIDFKRSYRVISHVQTERTGTNQEIGLITFSRFAKGSCFEIKQALLSFNQTQTKSLILDLRGNPGGQLDEAVCIAGLLLGPDKSAYYVEYAGENQPNEVVLTDHEQIYSGSLVVLVNHQSASASELLAGALKDYRRAVLIGRRTFGKGTFQEPEEWPSERDVSFFKTRGYYLLPSQLSTQIVGVEPDITLAKKDREMREADSYINPMPKKANIEIVMPIVANGKITSAEKIRCVAKFLSAKEHDQDELAAGLDFIKCTSPQKQFLNKANLATKNKKEI